MNIYFKILIIKLLIKLKTQHLKNIILVVMLDHVSHCGVRTKVRKHGHIIEGW